MKKLTIYIAAITFTVLLSTSCKSTKGCGLTSDASKIDNITNSTIIVAETK
ncbi:hypothetical protein [uncultured Lutibacter sp.]|uniref:hypothetical protein n=1 Tax=uncultured Lutibacter sp. TaxID=437739 RepID=UPI0026308017|nr:hypothetical protein [uncultured Lutibacter sp.]